MKIRPKLKASQKLEKPPQTIKPDYRKNDWEIKHH